MLLTDRMTEKSTARLGGVLKSTLSSHAWAAVHGVQPMAFRLSVWLFGRWLIAFLQGVVPSLRQAYPCTRWRLVTHRNQSHRIYGSDRNYMYLSLLRTRNTILWLKRHFSRASATAVNRQTSAFMWTRNPL